MGGQGLKWCGGLDSIDHWAKLDGGLLDGELDKCSYYVGKESETAVVDSLDSGHWDSGVVLGALSFVGWPLL